LGELGSSLHVVHADEVGPLVEAGRISAYRFCPCSSRPRAR
jgi:hypothetical protein